MKKTIVVVECYSSSVNYIHDIRKQGYEPILLELYAPQKDMAKIRAINDKAYAFIEEPIPQILQAEKTYEKTLKMISKLPPVLILPGADTGLELSLKLSSDLKLKSNPFSIFWNLRDKFIMQEILKNAGLRYVKSCIIRSEEEAVDLYRKEFRNKVVIKPTQSAASKNVFVCSSETEVKNAFRINEQFIKQRNKKEEKIIMQEYIDGQEYAVDTISCEGRHAALFGMKYKKRICKGYGKIYGLKQNCISGIHINFSFTNEMFDKIRKIYPSVPDDKDETYFKCARQILKNKKAMQHFFYNFSSISNGRHYRQYLLRKCGKFPISSKCRRKK